MRYIADARSIGLGGSSGSSSGGDSSGLGGLLSGTAARANSVEDKLLTFNQQDSEAILVRQVAEIHPVLVVFFQVFAPWTDRYIG